MMEQFRTTNPVVGRAAVRPEIYAYGNRNPQGLAIDPRTGALFRERTCLVRAMKSISFRRSGITAGRSSPVELTMTAQ